MELVVHDSIKRLTRDLEIVVFAPAENDVLLRSQKISTSFNGKFLSTKVDDRVNLVDPVSAGESETSLGVGWSVRKIELYTTNSLRLPEVDLTGGEILFGAVAVRGVSVELSLRTTESNGFHVNLTENPTNYILLHPSKGFCSPDERTIKSEVNAAVFKPYSWQEQQEFYSAGSYRIGWQLTESN